MDGDSEASAVTKASDSGLQGTGEQGSFPCPGPTLFNTLLTEVSSFIWKCWVLLFVYHSVTHKQENLLGVADFRVYTMSLDEKREIDTFQIKKNKLLRFRRAYKWSRHIWASPGSSVGKESACNARDLVSIPGLGRSPGEGNGNPLQYSCLGSPMNRRAWLQSVGSQNSRTQLGD